MTDKLTHDSRPFGDAFVVTKLDRLARSVPDARDIADELAEKGVVLQTTGQKTISIGGITRIFAGSNSTTWCTGGTGTFLAPNVGKNYASGQSYTSITRS